MVSKIKTHIFFATMAFLFAWYYLVDTLPRSRLIPHYVAATIAAAQQAAAAGQLDSLAVAQPGFYLDNPAVSVRPGGDDALEIVFSQASKRRCEQLAANAQVKQAARQVVIAGGVCGALNEVTLIIPRS